MARWIMFSVAIVIGCSFFANASTLTCKKGAATSSDKNCGTTVVSEPGAANSMSTNEECTTENHQCLTAKYNGDWLAAYGCYHNDDIEGAKAFWVELCKADSSCNDNNDGGVPANGYTTCNTAECNECNSTGELRGSVLLVLVGAVLVLGTHM